MTGKPPWTFIAREIKPRESPTDADVRELQATAGVDHQHLARPVFSRPPQGRSDPGNTSEERFTSRPEPADAHPAAITASVTATAIAAAVRVMTVLLEMRPLGIIGPRGYCSVDPGVYIGAPSGACHRLSERRHGQGQDFSPAHLRMPPAK
jgi:hypothetical protein